MQLLFTNPDTSAAGPIRMARLEGVQLCTGFCKSVENANAELSGNSGFCILTFVN